MTELTVLVCPLDWGIGHATRCVPVIRLLQKYGMKVILAADRRPLEFLKKEFPGTGTIVFPGPHVTYNRKGPLWVKLLAQLPQMFLSICREHRFLHNVIRKEKIDLVISDNRYGLYSRKVPCIFITHQLQPVFPPGLGWFSSTAGWIIRRFLKRFGQVWVPDFENHFGLAGTLSHPRKVPANVTYIGTLSRFTMKPGPEQPDPGPVEILVLLSGPEPQRTILEEKIIRQLKNTDLQAVLVRGITERNETYQLSETIRVLSHAETPLLNELLRRAMIVICRSGYSSIMDVTTMGKRAIFIPTPGQSEQEYLSRYLMDKKIYFSMGQEEFDLFYALELSQNYPGMVLENDYQELERRIRGEG